MTISAFLAELRRRDRVLFTVALAHVAALVVFLIAIAAWLFAQAMSGRPLLT